MTMGLMEDLRWIATKLVNVGKFAVDSAMNESLKGSKAAFAIVKEKFKGEIPTHLPYGGKRQNFLLVEEMQAKLEKLRDELNINKQQQDEVSTCGSNKYDLFKQFADEPSRSSIPEATLQKKIFIRSRL